MKKITFRHMDPTPDIKNYADAALERVMHALEGERTPVDVHLIIEPGRPHAHHQVELLIKTPHYNVISKEEGPHPYQLLDRACDLACRKIHEQKKRLLDGKKKDDIFKGA